MLHQRKSSFLLTGKVVLLNCIGITLMTLCGALIAPQHANAAPKEGEVFPHMDAAMGYLKTALGELQKAEPEFAGHREKAMQHVNAAMADLQKGMDNYLAAHPSTVRNETTPEAPPAEGAQFPHMRGALKLLQQAAAQLNEATPQYNGKRIEGLQETKAAIAEVEAGLKLRQK